MKSSLWQTVIGGLVVAALTLAAAGTARGEIFVAPLGPGGEISVYETVTTGATWTTAQAAAQAKTDPLFGSGAAGNLIAINSQAENDFMQTFIRSSGNWYIGGTDQAVEGEWRWINDGTQFWQGKGSGSGGTPVGGNYTNWNGTGEPNDAGGEDYAVMYGSSGKWNDIYATYSTRYVIEYETGITAIPATTGTLVLNPANGKYYERMASANWITSKAMAESRSLNGVQGKLAEVNDADENTFLARLGGGWMGLTDDERFGGAESLAQPDKYTDGWVWSQPADTTGTYQTTPLTTTGYTNWNPGEPNGWGEDVAEIQSSGRWNDLSTQSRNGLVEYETGTLADLNFTVTALKDSGGGTGGVNAARDLFNGRRTPAGLPVTGQYAAINFVDPQAASGGSFNGDVPFPNDTPGGDDNFAIKAIGAVVIPAAGTYTFGGNHDDAFELVIDRGTDPSAVLSAGTGSHVITTTFAQAGTYNVWLLMGESGGGAGVELAAAPGTFADYGSLVSGGGKLVGDTLNGGLATAPDPIRTIVGPSGFIVRDVRSTGGVGDLNAVDNLLDNGLPGILREATGSYQVVNFLDTGGNGRFGQDSRLPADDPLVTDESNIAIEATATIIVEPGNGGLWTFGVNSDDGFRLTIEDALGVVAFSAAYGDAGTAIVDGSLIFPSGRGVDDSLGIISLPDGIYDVTLRWWEGGGGAAVELYYAPGVHDTFNGAFDLLRPVPEPATLALLGLGALALVRRRRRTA